MAAELITPMDELSGLPLPIAPGEEYLPADDPSVADWHHEYHPASHPDLKTVGGMALRNSRLQLVDLNYHNHSPKSYHRFYEGPEIPTDPHEQFRLCVLACAGYVPEQGIDLSSGEPQIVDLTPRQKAQLGQMDPDDGLTLREIKYRYDPIRDFFTEYALEQDISHMREDIIDEFVYTGQVDREKFLGHLLIAKAAEAAGELVAEDYHEVRTAGKLHPLMPRQPSTLIKNKLGNAERREQLIPELKGRLMSLYGLETVGAVV